MSVLQLRRDLRTPDEQVVEIEKPIPLRTRPIDVEAVQVNEPDARDRPRRKTFLDVVRAWLIGLGTLALLAAYPVLIVMGSKVGDRTPVAVDRAQWTAPWTGGAALLMERHFATLGWAGDAPSWAPMARLTAKPAYQSAMAETLGDYFNLMQRQSAARGQQDADLTAAARLVSVTATGVQMRAARDALVSYDRRLHRRNIDATPSTAQLAAQLGLIESWATHSQDEIDLARQAVGGAPIDKIATTAVYKAKGRAATATTILENMAWPEEFKAAAARTAAIAAWKAAAQFHPLVVLNGSPDGSLFGDHPSTMGFLLNQAQKATADYRAALTGAASADVAEASPGVSAAEAPAGR